jgi:hypothetical protein
MKPIRSNSQKETCSPISSNCVVWQGPDLQCINLCNGDSVSDVTYKMAVEVCTLKEDLGLSDIDLTCLVQVCQTTPEPTKTLSNILKLLVTKVCCLSDIVENIPDPGTPYVEPTLKLPNCLQYPDGTGGNVTELRLELYVTRIAAFLCELNQTVENQQDEIYNPTDGILKRLDDLENAPDPTPQINSCLFQSLEAIDIVVEELEDQFCSYKTALGTTGNINTAIGKQCENLNSELQLATGEPMPLLGNSTWVTNVQNLAQSINNLWLTVCDIRAAIKIIQTNCCQVNCDDIIIDFDYVWIDEVTINAFFTPKSFVPLGFYDCNTVDGNKFTVTDGNGNVSNIFIHFRMQDPNDKTGVLDDLTDIQDGTEIAFKNPLDTTTGLTITSNLCFTNGDTNCIKCFTKTLPPYVNKDCCTITSSVTNTIVYRVCPTTTTTSSPS